MQTPTQTSKENDEATYVKGLLQNMATYVEPESKWYVISKVWINRWEQYIGFDDGKSRDTEATETAEHPGTIDNKDLIEQFYKDDNTG